MIDVIRDKLERYNGKTIDGPVSVCAGAVIPIFERDGQTFIVLTKRTDTVRMHKGEVSFPGGVCEEEDDDTMVTALRECCEEIGVKRQDIEVIGKLDDTVTLTGFVITPYVGIIPYPYEFKTSPREVAYLIYLPFEYLEKVEPVLEVAEHTGRFEHVPSFYYEGDRIWGATCRILLSLRRIVADGKI